MTDLQSDTKSARECTKTMKRRQGLIFIQISIKINYNGIATPLSWMERISLVLSETHQMLRPAQYPTMEEEEPDTADQTSLKQ